MTTGFLGDMTLQADSPVPLYFQLQTKIKLLIETGQLAYGDRLPSERQIAELAMINRLTVRQALTALANEGVLTRRRGLGTFVATPKLEHGLAKLTSFTEDMQRRGLTPSTVVLSLGIQAAEQRVAQALGLAAGEEVIVLERLRLADGTPMALEVSHLPCRRFPDFLTEGFDFARTSLYDTLRRHYNVNFARAIETLEARSDLSREAELLGIASGSPLLARERTTLDITDVPLEHVRSLYRADRYRFVIEVAM